MDNIERARRIKMILMDVDGTLTDGTLAVMPDGEEIKSYHVWDGMGILMAHLAGFQTGIITGKTSKGLEFRAARLRIQELHQGVLDKARILQTIMKKYGLAGEEIAYIGDDLGDLSILKRVGLAGAVADAHPQVLEQSHFICQKEGGKGAVREFLEFIFQAQDKWSQIHKKLDGLTGAKL